MNGANEPPAPRLAPRPLPSANWALPSDCFWKATASTRRCLRAWMCDTPTTPVVPPTEPAVWTRNIGLPIAPSASERYSSGFITPSNRSGALPSTTASMSAIVMWASSRARNTASRTRPPYDTSRRRDLWWVWPMPTTAHGSELIVLRSPPLGQFARFARSLAVSLQHAHQVLLQARSRRRVGEGPAAPGEDVVGGVADPHQSG